MRKISLIAVAAALACGGSSSNTAANVYVANLTSAGEFPTPPKPNANATATATLTVNADNTVSYTIPYSGLSGPPTLAHIHGGAAGSAGAPVTPVFPNLPTTTSGTITGSFAAADIATGAGGIVKGDLNSLVAAMKAGNAYANIHTANNPQGEIRGQLGPK